MKYKVIENFTRKLDQGRVQCQLCPHECNIGDGKSGICGVRINKQGELYTENYGQLSSAAIDPVEKKPLYHFYPGTEILSLGTYGCNFSCDFCQNWSISQEKPNLQRYQPGEIVQIAEEKGVVGIAYTYSEPSVWYEYVFKTSQLAREKGLKNVLVTNGYLNREPLEKLLPYIDGVNIDLKAFNNDFYREYCGGKLQPVMDNIELMNGKVHLEVTTLLITGLNDSEEELDKLFAWLKSINPSIPLHLSRYFPNCRMNKPATPVNKLKQAYEQARGNLNHVYLGNVNLEGSSNTFCPECGEEVITRNVYKVKNKLNHERCPVCNNTIYGEFK